MPNVPIPAAARYRLAGEPGPPAPTTSTRAALSRSCPAAPISGNSRWRLYRSRSDGRSVMGCRDADKSAAAQCADQMDLIRFQQRLIERLYLALIDEDTDMRADAILFVDHAKAHARMHALQIGE